MTVVDETVPKLPEKLGEQFRSVPIEVLARGRADSIPVDGAEPGDEDEVFTITLSVEGPVDVGWALETLSHDESAVDMSYARTGLTLFLEHGGPLWNQTGYRDPDMRVGVVENIRLKGRRLVGDARFNLEEEGRKTRRLFLGGFLKFTSIGWKPGRSKVIKQAKTFEEKSQIEWTRWTPIEASIASIPADPRSTTGRTAGSEEFPVDWQGSDPGTEESKMDPNITTPTATVEVLTPGGGAGAEGRSLDAAVAERTKDINANINAIYDLCSRIPKAQGRAKEFVDKGYSLQQAKSVLFDELATAATRQLGSEQIVNHSEKEARAYSYCDAIEAAVQLREGRRPASHAFDVHQDIEKKLGRSSAGIFVPMQVGPLRERGRAMVTNVPTKGQELVFDQPQQIIEILRAQSAMSRLGARTLFGLVGNPNWPRQSGDITVTAQGENPATGVSPTDVKLDYILAQPRTFTGRGEFSRQLMIQASYDTEAMVRESLGEGHALAIDRQGFHGTGSGGQLLGLYNTPDVLSVAMGSVEPTWTKITDMIGAVSDANAKRGTLGFVTTALMEARLMAKLKASSAGSDFIAVPNGDESRIGGYRAIGSTQISKVLGSGGDEHGFIFGNWNDVILCGWGALEIIVDPFTKADKGMIAITSFQMADVVIRHGQSFCVATAAKLS